VLEKTETQQESRMPASAAHGGFGEPALGVVGSSACACLRCRRERDASEGAMKLSGLPSSLTGFLRRLSRRRGQLACGSGLAGVAAVVVVREESGGGGGELHSRARELGST
jgi:hypothetical protein